MAAIIKELCTSLKARPDGSGNPGTGRDEPPFLSAENSIPGEVDTVVRGAFHPRDHYEEDVSLPSDSKNTMWPAGPFHPIKETPDLSMARRL